MKDTLVKYKTAWEAKIKGFDWECFKWYDGEQDIAQYSGYRMDSIITNKEIDENLFYRRIPCARAMPTQALLQKWLRENHYLHLSIDPGINGYHCYLYYRELRKVKDHSKCEWVNTEKFSEKTYEEALELGLQKALNLIQII